MSYWLLVSHTTPAASPLLQFSLVWCAQSKIVVSLPLHFTSSNEKTSELACLATVAAFALLNLNSLQATCAASMFQPSSQMGFLSSRRIPSDCEFPTRVRAAGFVEEERCSTGNFVRV